MKIIQEKPSLDGNIHVNEIDDILRITKKDNQYIRGSDFPQWVIWCKRIGNKYYPIAHFPNGKKRDEAFYYIQSSNANTIVLDYNVFFTDPILTSMQVKDSLVTHNMCLDSYLKHWIERTMRQSNINFVSLLELDAFKDFSLNHMNRWSEGIPIKIDIEREIKYSSVWAKCLYTPRKYLDMGITPQQFFTTLIKLNNEKFTDNTTGSTPWE